MSKKNVSTWNDLFMEENTFLYVSSWAKKAVYIEPKVVYYVQEEHHLIHENQDYNLIRCESLK